MRELLFALGAALFVANAFALYRRRTDGEAAHQRTVAKTRPGSPVRGNRNTGAPVDLAAGAARPQRHLHDHRVRRHGRRARSDTEQVMVEHARVGRRASGPDRPRAACARRASRPDAGTRRGAGPGARVRGVPHRPPSRRGRSRADAAPAWCPATRSSAWSTSAGPARPRFAVGDADRHRVVAAHVRASAAYCRRGDENLCIAPRFTGWDDDGGYADYAVVDEAFAYALPDEFDDETAAPLLCSGIIGYRALRRSRLQPGGRLGIYGFGASAHLAAQIALHEGATVHVLTRVGGRAAARARPRVRDREATRTTRRPNRSTPRCCSRRSATSCRSRCARSTAAARLLDRGHPPHRHPGAALRRRAVRGDGADEHDRQHPARRRGAAGARGADAAAGRRPCPTRSTGPTPRSRDLAHDRVNGAAVVRVS